MNADNYYPVAVLSTLRTLAERVQSYAVGIVGEDGYLRAIIEKPDASTLDGFGRDALISMNCWRFSPTIFQACRHLAPSPRGELELPSAVNEAVTVMGARIRVVRCRAGVLDLSHRSDIATVAEKLRGIEGAP
jgi:glucose-1-phosphate thymidylyltransferase